MRTTVQSANGDLEFIVSPSLPLARDSGCLGKGTAAAGSALPIPISACSISVCPNSGMAASVWRF